MVTIVSSEDLVMAFEKPHFTVKLHKTLLEVDLKEGAKRELEDFLESNPRLRESVGLLFQNMIPLDVALRNIQTVSLDKKGRVKIAVPRRKDITIPLELDESQALMEKMNELIPIEKARAAEELREAQKAGKEFEPQRARMEASAYREREGRI